MRTRGDLSWGPLSEDQKRLAEQYVRYVGWYLTQKKIQSFIRHLGWEECRSIMFVALCRAAWYYKPDHPSGCTFQCYLAWQLQQSLVNASRRRENDGTIAPFDFQECEFESSDDFKPTITPVDNHTHEGLEPEEVATLSQRLQQLTPRQREIVVRTIALDEGVMNVARSDGISHNAVICVRKRAMNKLRRMYGCAGDPQRRQRKSSKKLAIAA